MELQKREKEIGSENKRTAQMIRDSEELKIKT